MRPNILLLHCHDIGRFVGAYDTKTVQTPNLDALAERGVRFSDAFCTAPQCSPSRASLFTGRYPQQNGVLGLTHADFGWDLASGEEHIAAMLHAHGYNTGLIGVHHESRTRPDLEIASRLGFDSVNSEQVDAQTVADRAIGNITQLADSERPFYLQVGFHEPHRVQSSRDTLGVVGFLRDGVEPDDQLGLTIPPYLYDDAGARAEVAELQGAVRYMDHGVGKVLHALHEQGLAENTVVVFTTDHGLAMPRAKGTLYDPGLEVAALIHVPMRRAWLGRVVDGLISNVDFLPTLLELAGLDIPKIVAGHSLVPMVESGAPGRSEIFAQLTYHTYYDPRRCVRTDRYKLIANFSSAPDVMDSSDSWRPRSTPRSVIRADVDFHSALEIYDLHADPHEFTNIANAIPQTTRDALVSSLAMWMREVDDPLLNGAVTSPMHHRSREELLRR